ncbi:MAG: DNA polymerase III subunit gamma/tau [Alphaproteobacteria bacterium GM202ARS2]|nr:DNA polymerase III subunit gamma/tau [Alphaproteobacteria bacterium GM202ARS2]
MTLPPSVSDKNDSSLFGAPKESASAEGAFTGERIALARRYRPRFFDDVLGQETVVRILKNAVATERVGHALLLAGPRGTGKTTLARLIARAVNCLADDPQAKPCGVCAACQDILAERYLDVIEMDAASHTGVDHIRELIEHVPYKPVQGRFKVCIVDEVHMLSRSAFNALLKTLEEPPSHVIFIFATTEPEKIPLTVLSRCQRFDLGRVEPSLIASCLVSVASSEGFSLEEQAAHIIARRAEGSLRDALSLLDAACCGATDKKITSDLVVPLLGISKGDDLVALLDTMCRGDSEGALALVRTLYGRGASAESLLCDLLDVSYGVLLVKMGHAPPPWLAVNDKTDALVQGLSKAVLLRLWQMLVAGFDDVRLAPHALAALEVVALRVMHGLHLPTIDKLVAELAPPPSNVTPSPPPSVPSGSASPIQEKAQEAESREEPAVGKPAVGKPAVGESREEDSLVAAVRQAFPYAVVRDES